jgi:hypothetical protein
MVVNHVICHGKELLVRTVNALDFSFVTEPSNPFIGTDGTIATLAGLAALKAPRIDIIPTAEQ